MLREKNVSLKCIKYIACLWLFFHYLSKSFLCRYSSFVQLPHILQGSFPIWSSLSVSEHNSKEWSKTPNTKE